MTAGAPPTIPPRVPVLRPKLPDRAALAPYLDRIDSARWYSNRGPLMVEAEARLAAHFGLDPAHIVLVTSGTMGLTVALSALGARPGGACLMPSWTFAGSPAAAATAGLVPHFWDVDPALWALTPDIAAEAMATLAEPPAAVMPVAPFGAPLDRAAWDAFTARTGTPVVIDAAAAFDATTEVDGFRPGPTPQVISLHATKAFGIGEGGLVLSTDTELMDRVRQAANFGFQDKPEAEIMGWNAKLSEYACAVLLAMLDQWPERRTAWARRTDWYIDALAPIDGVTLAPGYGDGWISSYCCVRVDDAPALARRLADQGIETRPWWRQGCHRQPAYAGQPRGPLPNTEALAATTLGLPFSIDLGPETVGQVAAAVARALDEALSETRPR
ncbi:hypothetical protein CCR85_02580 [Rhodothalassium salexigens]|uniref:DegT/DnrJ/EryC1/StrS family aminotransferase n=1 Tax=Rhodothalassium salexigens TaxID=1086 RepID=UPI001913DF98|nr:aminotransferase class I/II-fold pyridoxal phosphate-dependent enzyme [Rhodothalassium salexigens]MBK5910376.1 hypothetical protein [Rhodothalassium salexigens]